MNSFGRTAVTILALLALFQLSEYQICTGSYTLFWARIGIIAVTLLPILGIHLILILNNTTRVLKAAYIIALASIIFFSFSSTAVTGAVCGGNYIIFQSEHAFYWLYTVYYLSLLFIGIWKSYEQMIVAKEKADKIRLSILRWIIAGYLSFMLPMAFIYAFYESARNGVASIMCGFAIIFALILALRVIALYYRSLKNN